MQKYILVLIFLFIAKFAFAQTTFTISSDTPVKVSVKGSSTLHEWEAIASDVTDYPQTISTDLSSATAFEGFGFKVGVESLDGGRGASMNKKIKKALLSTEHPKITFSVASVDLNATDEGQVLKSLGTVVIAGKEMEIEVNAGIELSDNELIIKGSKALKMSDFDIEPPTAMFGQIKTRDDITVHFEFKYIAEKVEE